MGEVLYKPDNISWEEWMCELMCGTPEEDFNGDDEDDRTDKTTSTDKRIAENK